MKKRDSARVTHKIRIIQLDHSSGIAGVTFEKEEEQEGEQQEDAT